MKKLYSLILLVMIASSAFSTPYYIYVAKKSGAWNDLTLWNINVRGDGVARSKVVIPSAFTVSVDNGVNAFGLGDVDIDILGTLNMALNTTINLTATSSIEINGPGKIIGTSNTQTIIIGGVVKYDGSIDLTKSGRSIASAATGVSPNGFYAFSVLPVTFNSFSVSQQDKDINIRWSTASEINNAFFEVERSFDGRSWTVISKQTGAGSATAISTYQYTDNNATSEIIYYRIKQTDIDGNFNYSSIKTIHAGQAQYARVYASNKNLNIDLKQDMKNTLTVMILNTNGQLLDKKDFNAGSKINMNLSARNEAVLLVRITDNKHINQTAKIIL
jgi:hypothetical protein